jgi:glycosyltransferase involved in cell wall biosynthesis/GT2 family glycosyltransferase
MAHPLIVTGMHRSGTSLAASLLAAWNVRMERRTSLLLDFWDDRLGGEARYLLLYRHPWEVADSMLRTGAKVWLTHPGYPARIWTHYNRRILDFHRRHRERTLLVSTNRLLRDPEAFATAVRRRFGIEADAATLAALHSEGSFHSLPDDDPLPRLWRSTNPAAMELLGALDDAADLGNDRRWEAASSPRAPQPAEPPHLSVIVPCHDDGDYLIDAVASVERNASAAELIIVDDGSTQPRTCEVLAALGEAGYRVIHQPHSGLSAARNCGIAASSSEYFLPLDADNRLLPGFADEAVALLDADPATGVVYGDRRELGARSGDVAVPELELPALLWSNTIDACAVIRRAVWNDAGGYDVTLPAWEDWDFWLGAVEHGWRFVRIPRPTFEYRVRPDSMLDRFLHRADYPSILRRIYDKHRDLVAAQAAEILVAGHVERHQLFGHIESLRASRDAIQLEIDRLAAGTPLAGAASEAALTKTTRVFTIVARNYLAYARVLAASLARHNPGARLAVVLLDDPDRSIPPEPSFEIIHADELPFDPPSDFLTMAAIYDVTELATAVKPWVFEYLFDRGASVAIHLDPDTEIFDSLGPLEPLTRERGMVLTPHVTEPLPRDGKRPDERDLLLAGIYNLGFLALSAEGAKVFLPWWRERLRRDCLNDPAAGLFVDQRWIDFAPALFEPAILKDPGYNVAYWNLPHRALTRDDGRIFVRDGSRIVNGRPLRFFHYSGFSPRAPHVLSKHQHAPFRIRLSDTPLLAELCQRYAAALEEAGFSDSGTFPYGFAATAAGLPLDARARRVLRRTYIEDEAEGRSPSFRNPFSEAGADDVVQRLLRPSPRAPGVPAWLGEIWSERADLRAAFPRIDSFDAERFLEWVRTQGVREYDIPPQLIPPATREARRSASRQKTLTPGVNVYGYAFAESGTGQIVRSVVAALAAEGIPYAVVPFTRTLSRQQRVFRDFGTAAPTFDTNLICVNADQVPLFFQSLPAKLLPGARNIGLWAWEVEGLPSAMAGSERHLDEVWGISSFTAAALARSLTKPVRAFPLPVVVPQVTRRTRAELGMPEGFLFLFCFDYDSVFRRKNPLAVVAAFRQAFPDRDGVVLYIKTTNGERHPAESELLRAAVRDRANIVIRDAYLSSDDYFSMLDACDCYVSLHRSEGFGLTVAEAMALGKPVISTAYSATLEFANESNTFPVPARIVEVGGDAPPYPPHARWAEPDVAAAAEQMARVHADHPAAAAVGARARADIEALHGPSARGPLLRRLLEENRRARDTLAAGAGTATTALALTSAMTFEPIQPPSAEPPAPFEAEALAVESLLGSPRPNLPSRMQRLMTPFRRLVLRCIRVYWVQQLAVDRALLAVIRTLRRESHSETSSQAMLLQQQGYAQERISAETAHLREELTKVATELRTLHDRIGAMADMIPAPVQAKAPAESDPEERQVP